MTLRLAARFGADVRIFCGSGVRPLAQRLLGGMDRATPIEWTKTAQWSDVRALLESDWPPDDLFVFLAARRGALSWRPPIERLFADLAARHPEARLLMMYPPAFHDLPGAATERPSTKRPLCFLPSDGGLYPAQPPESSLRTLLDTLLGDYFGHRPEHLAALRAQLMGVAAQFPIELAPGIVLLHAHCTEVETPVLFVGTLSEPMPLIHQAEPVRGVFVLLSPLHFAPDQHVQNLASLARLLQVPGATEQLLSANTADALRTALNNLASAS